MQIVRTIVWVLLLVVLVIFSINNWSPVEVKIWEGLVLETKIPALVVVSLLLGLLPMWLMHRVSQWYYKRRLGSLENAARAAALTPAPAAAPVADPVPEELRTEMPPPATQPAPATEPDPLKP
jgi:lipopolysaccharide assembly protein A